MKNQFAGSVLRDGYLYGLDEAILACVDADTGELKWKGGRYGYGQVVLADDHLIVLAENGDLALVRATPERHRITSYNVCYTKLLRQAGKPGGPEYVRQGYLLLDTGRNVLQYAYFLLRGQ